LIEHLALRVRERAVPIEDLQNLAKWLDTDPTVPSAAGSNVLPRSSFVAKAIW